MGQAPYEPYRKREKRSRRSLLLFLAAVFVGIRLLGSHLTHVVHAAKPLPKPQLPILSIADSGDAATPDLRPYHLEGKRVRGNGTDLDLGDQQTHLPESILARFFPSELVLPSCLTQLPPPAPLVEKPLPVRDDWPGFYGAPWTAHSNGNLIALLHVYAARNGALPVSAPAFEIYPDYTGQQTIPAFSSRSPATFTRGSKAVLYRVFPNGPVRCLDLLVENGENNGIGHLYYQMYHHYYETDAVFQIQP